MTEYNPRQIQTYYSGKTVVSARDMNDISRRIERLEKLNAILPLKVSGTNSFNIMLTHEVHECQVVKVYDTPDNAGIKAGRNFLYKGYLIEQDLAAGHYGSGDSKIYGYQPNTSKTYWFRNPFLFTGNDDDWAFIAKMPQLGNDYILIQIMCPGAIVDPDAPVLPFYSSATPAAGGYSARYRIPIPLIPGMINDAN